MVVRPESPINAPHSDDDWFKEYMWMNEQENFEEEYLDSLHLEEVYNFTTSVRNNVCTLKLKSMAVTGLEKRLFRA